MCTQLLVKYYLIDSVLVHAIFLNQFTDNCSLSMIAGQNEAVKVRLYNVRNMHSLIIYMLTAPCMYAHAKAFHFHYLEVVMKAIPG